MYFKAYQEFRRGYSETCASVRPENFAKMALPAAKPNFDKMSCLICFSDLFKHKIKLLNTGMFPAYKCIL